MKADDIRVRDAGERSLAAALRTPEGMAAEQRGAPVDADELRRIGVLRRLDELDFAVTIGRELLRFESRTHQRIGQQLDHERAIARQELAADRNRLGARPCGEAAAHAFDCVGELEGVAFSGAAIEQAGDQRSDAGLAGGIRECTAAYEAAERDQRYVFPAARARW